MAVSAKKLASNRRWMEAHPDCVRAIKRRWHLAHPRAAHAWRERNPELALERERARRARLPDKRRAEVATRRARKEQRTPVWADLQKIKRVYKEAVALTTLLGEPWHVDHVIPLHGKRVSGLHVHFNLQLLPGVENMRKHNSFDQVAAA